MEGDTRVDLGFADVGALLGTDGWGEHAALAERVSPRSGRGRLRPCGPPSRQDHLRRANYRQHIHEMGWVLQIGQLERWLEAVPGPLTVGNYGYSDGAAFSLLSVAFDLCFTGLSGKRDDLPCLLLPSGCSAGA